MFNINLFNLIGAIMLVTNLLENTAISWILVISLLCWQLVFIAIILIITIITTINESLKY